MHLLLRWFVGLGVVVTLLTPISALAIGFSFGGRLVSTPIACLNLPGFYGIVIRPAGRLPVTYVYSTGFTIGLPPTHPGQQILGLYDIPMICNGVPGFRIQRDGVSI